MSSKPLELIQGQPAYTLLHDDEFLERWQTLHSNCPHASVFQTPEFVTAWYEAYQTQWQPLILYTQQATGELTGLLLLAYNPATKNLVHAGDEQAEYHAWLALPSQDGAFLSAAWDELTQTIDFAKLRFQYLLSGTLADTLKNVPSMQHIAVRKYQRPLMILDAADIKASFAKKSNKSRFNRLKKLGNVEFRRITEANELERVFDELIAFYDFRQAAVNHVTHFQNDPHKREFHTKLFATAPDKVTVTVTYLDERPIAGFWGYVTGNTVHLGMIMHSPSLAEHSLGKLHIMQLSDLLLQQGKVTLDITPGLDPWKERFANAHDEVAEAIVYRTALAKIQGELFYCVWQSVKHVANLVGITAVDIKSTLAMLRRLRPASAICKLKHWISEDREFRLYRIERAVAKDLRQDERLCCDSIDDLLAFEQTESGQSRDNFLSNALYRLEQGEHVYTLNSDNRLVHCAWMMANKAKSYMSEFKQSIPFPLGSITLYDIYSHPELGSSDDYQSMLNHLLHTAFSHPNTQYVYISVPTDNPSNQLIIETMGFEYQASFFLKRRFGIEKTVSKS